MKLDAITEVVSGTVVAVSVAAMLPPASAGSGEEPTRVIGVGSTVAGLSISVVTVLPALKEDGLASGGGRKTKLACCCKFEPARPGRAEAGVIATVVVVGVGMRVGLLSSSPVVDSVLKETARERMRVTSKPKDVIQLRRYLSVSDSG
jgi:hypothetical protein